MLDLGFRVQGLGFWFWGSFLIRRLHYKQGGSLLGVDMAVHTF